MNSSIICGQKSTAYKILIILYAVIPIFHIHIPLLAQTTTLPDISMEIWHNKLSATLNLKKNEFKYCQGNETIGNTNNCLWDIFNSIISNDSGIYYNPSQYNNFSTNYGLMLYNSPKWINNEEGCKLSDAIIKYQSADCNYAWDKSINDLLIQLDTSGGLIINFDTTVYDLLNHSYSIKIQAEFKNISIFYSLPYSSFSYSRNVYEKNKPWFSICFFKKAYENDNKITLNHCEWDNAISLHGYMKSYCKALIIIKTGCIKINVINENKSFSVNRKIDNIPTVLGVLISSIDAIFK